MTAKTTTIAECPEPSEPRRPTHRLYRVTGDGNASIWTPIGAAWPNKDGMGFSLSVDALPLAGRIVMRRITERSQAEGAQQ